MAEVERAAAASLPLGRASRGWGAARSGASAVPAASAGPPKGASRLPVRGVRAKRSAVAREAAAEMPEQKRARPGSSARAPLRPLSVTAARPGPPPKAAAASRAAGAPPPARRPRWDLRGQVSDLQGELRDRHRENSDLRDANQRLHHGLQSTQADLERCRAQLEEQQQQLEQQQQQLEEQQQQLEEQQQQLEQQQQQLEQQQQQLEEQQRIQRDLQEETGRLQRQLREEEERNSKAQEELGGTRAALQSVLGTLQQQQEQLQGREQQLEQQKQQLLQLELDRRRMLNQLHELKGNIRVFCRVRPVLPQEEPQGLGHLHFPPNDPKALVLSRPDESHVGRERRADLRYDFSFDRVFPPGASQQEIFQEVELLVQSALDGYHVCIFAYGQTGSGKTFTMEGPDPQDPLSRGLIPRAVAKLFQGSQELAQKGWEYHFSASFLEIYNESLRDLLGGQGELEIRRVSPSSAELHVPNLRLVPVTREEEVLELLRVASSRRSVGPTAQNERSSRSHSVCQIHVHGRHPARDLRCHAVLSLVDLAGSERLGAGPGARGERLRETQNINSSLSALGLVIAALASKEPHVPYRNSKLTYLLQNSLGGAAKMLMLVTISPLEENLSETLNSLRFASKVNECVVGTAQANRK